MLCYRQNKRREHQIKNTKSLRWLIYGTGFISNKLAEAITNVEGNELYAVVSRSEERASNFARTHSIPVTYTDFAEALKDRQVDVVYAATPNHTHADAISACLTAKKPILCEKPLTVNLPQCQQIKELSQSLAVPCMEALMYYCHPLAQKLRELATHSPIGKFRTFDAMFSDKIFAFANPTAGGSIMDLGCYPVSLILSLVSEHLGLHTVETELIHAVGQLDPSNNTDAYASCQLALPGDIKAVISTSNRFGLASSFRIIGASGVIEIDNPWLAEKNNTITVSFFDDRADEAIIVTADRTLYEYEVLSMAAMIRDPAQTHPQVSLEHSADIMRVLDAWRCQIGLQYAIERV